MVDETDGRQPRPCDHCGEEAVPEYEEQLETFICPKCGWAYDAPPAPVARGRRDPRAVVGKKVDCVLCEAKESAGSPPGGFMTLFRPWRWLAPIYRCEKCSGEI